MANFDPILDSSLVKSIFPDKVIGKKVNKKQLKRWKKAGEKELVRYLSKFSFCLRFVIPVILVNSPVDALVQDQSLC